MIHSDHVQWNSAIRTVTRVRHNFQVMRHRRYLTALLLLPTLVAAGKCLAARSATGGFDLLEFAVEGNTVLPAIEIERAVYPWLGQEKSVSDIENARAALESAYHAAGYLSASVVIPEQTLAEGAVRLQVFEGQVDRLKVSGNRYTSRAELRAQVPELTPGQVPHFPSMQAELAAAGRSPDRRVTPLLRPGSRPGTMEVELVVEDELALHGNLELNNRQSPDTSTRRLETGIRYDNLFQKQHGVGLYFLSSPEKRGEVDMFSASYSIPLERGRSISAFLQDSSSSIATAADSSVLGKGSTLGLRYSLTLPDPVGVTGFFHSLSLGFDYKDLKETQNILGADQKLTPLRYTPFVAQYNAGLFGESGEFTAGLSAVANPSAGTRRIDCQGVDLDQFACRRSAARSNFGLLRGDLGYSKRFLGWEVATRLDFQAGAQALVSPEQILAGGADNVRGYFEGETAGDSGWRLKVEAKTPSLAEIDGAMLRAIAFAEGAFLWLNDPLAGQTSEFSIASVGLGLRLKSQKRGPLLALDLGEALKAGPRTRRGYQRLHMRLGYEF